MEHALESVFLFTMRARLDSARQDIGRTPRGYRTIVRVSEGVFEGPRLQGVITPGARDWALMREDGVMEVDVRLTLKTDDAALIYVTYDGLVRKGKQAFAQRSRGITPDPGEIYFRTALRFETSAERYSWLNTVLAIGVGRLRPGEVQYDIYEIL